MKTFVKSLSAVTGRFVWQVDSLQNNNALPPIQEAEKNLSDTINSEMDSIKTEVFQALEPIQFKRLTDITIENQEKVREQVTIMQRQLNSLKPLSTELTDYIEAAMKEDAEPETMASVYAMMHQIHSMIVPHVSSPDMKAAIPVIIKNMETWILSAKEKNERK